MGILTELKLGIIIVLLLSIIAFSGYFSFEMHLKNNQISNLTDLESKLTGENIRLQTTIEDQNTSIAKWQDEAKVKDIKLRKVEKDIQINYTQSQKDTSEINNMIIPAGCESAMKFSVIQAQRMGVD